MAWDAQGLISEKRQDGGRSARDIKEDQDQLGKAVLHTARQEIADLRAALAEQGGEGGRVRGTVDDEVPRLASRVPTHSYTSALLSMSKCITPPA